jgi:hypothetical protein
MEFKQNSSTHNPCMQIVPAAPSYVASREKKTPRRGAGAPKKKLPEKKIQKLAEVGQEN